MQDLFRSMLIILVILYVISPVDACPGPIDDIILILLAIAKEKKDDDD